MMRVRNLFANLEAALPEELNEVLAEGSGPLRVERIVSHGHASADGFWYDQDTVEWVALLRGSAVLQFDGEDEPITLEPGDWLEIPAHCRHRVVGTDDAQPSVWLAVHWSGPAGSGC